MKLVLFYSFLFAAVAIGCNNKSNAPKEPTKNKTTAGTQFTLSKTNFIITDSLICEYLMFGETIVKEYFSLKGDSIFYANYFTDTTGKPLEYETFAGFLTALYVPLVPLFAWLILRTRPHWSAWPTSIGCLGGTWLLSGAQALDPVVGDAWVIASSLFWALHVLLVGRIAERMAAPFVVACGQFLVCGLISLAWAGFHETITFAGIRQASLAIAYAGVVSVGIGFTAQVIGQRYAQPADAAIILSAETVFAALFGFLLMGDRLNASGIAGCALILVCIIAVQLAPLTMAAKRSASRSDTVEAGR